jgi:hypothetical protein
MEEDYNLSEKQIETIAFNIYKDIQNYINENQEKYNEWFLDKRCRNIVVTLNGIEIVDYSQYKLCKNIFNRKD